MIFMPTCYTYLSIMPTFSTLKCISSLAVKTCICTFKMLTDRMRVITPTLMRLCVFLREKGAKSAVMSFSYVARFLPDTVDVLDGITDLSTHLLLIALHLRGTERRSL